MALTAENRTTSSTDARNSRYVQGGLTDVYSTRLGWWERRLFERASDDIKVVITQSDDQRPDLIAYRYYGRVNLAWLVLQYNNISDPTTELTAGTEILLPSRQRTFLGILTETVGGKPVK